MGDLALDQIGGKFYCKKFFLGLRKTTKELSWKIVGNVAVGSFLFFGDFNQGLIVQGMDRGIQLSI